MFHNPGAWYRSSQREIFTVLVLENKFKPNSATKWDHPTWNLEESIASVRDIRTKKI